MNNLYKINDSLYIILTKSLKSGVNFTFRSYLHKFHEIYSSKADSYTQVVSYASFLITESILSFKFRIKYNI